MATIASAAAVGEGDEGVVAGGVERVTVVPQLHHHVARAEQGLEPAQLGRGPGRSLGDQGGGDDPLAAPGEHHPVVGVRAGGGTHGDSGSPTCGCQVGKRPGSDGGEGLEAHRGAPLFPAGQMRHREGSAQAGIAGGIPGQDQEMGTLRVGHPVLRAGQPQGQLGAEHRRQPYRPGRLGEADHAVHAVVVGDGQSLQAQPGRLLDQLLGMGCPVQEAEVGVAVQLGVGHPPPAASQILWGPVGAPLVRPGRAVPAVPLRREGPGAAGQGCLQFPPWHRRVLVAHARTLSNTCSIRQRKKRGRTAAATGCGRPIRYGRLRAMATFITRFEAAPPGSSAEPSSRPQATSLPSGRPQAPLRLAIKDLIDMVGVPTTNGSKVVAAGARPAGADAACLAGTRAAEAKGTVVIVGKTNLHELAFGVTGINPWFGTPVNPLDSRLVPGGSSSGSAVAVGAHEADVAFGSDTGGSIRIPAACCGVVGLKTTGGRVSLDGVLPLAPSLDTVGPMARTVADVVRGMALLEPGFSPAPPGALGSEGRDPMVGRLRLPAEPGVDDAVDAALAAAGLRVTDVVLPGWWPATAAAMRILAAEAWQVHRRLWEHHADELSPDVSARLHDASSLTAAELEAAWQRARLWETEVASAFERVDFLALPVIAGPPPPLEDATRLTDIRYVAPFNLAGVPALALPVPASTPGIPPSLQLVGPRVSEERLLAVGLEVEAAAGASL